MPPWLPMEQVPSRPIALMDQWLSEEMPLPISFCLTTLPAEEKSSDGQISKTGERDEERDDPEDT